MTPFKLDRIALANAILAGTDVDGDERSTDTTHVEAELARQLGPHVPGAQEGDGLEALVNRMLRQAGALRAVHEAAQEYYRLIDDLSASTPEAERARLEAYRPHRAALAAAAEALR